jgi:hypothetical protein
MNLPRGRARENTMTAGRPVWVTPFHPTEAPDTTVERWLSGLRRTPGKREYLNSTGGSNPPLSASFRDRSGFHFCHRTKPTLGASHPMNLTTGTLIASLIWGSIGTGFFIYGWKQQSIPPLTGGLLLIIASYFIGSPLYMSLAGIAAIAGIFWLKGRDL